MKHMLSPSLFSSAFFFILLSYLCFLFSPTSNVVSQSPVAYYKFVLQWPRAVCPTFASNCISPLPNIPTIHGLWPETVTGVTPPIRNPAEKFNKNKFLDLLPELNIKWPTLLLRFTNQGFWLHEWGKHGKSSDFDQRQFFHKTLDVYSMIDPMNRMAHVGLHPGTYTLQTINSRLIAEYGGKVQIICITNILGFQVQELRFNVTFDSAGQPQVHPFTPPDQGCQAASTNGARFWLRFLS
ncbi:hypothetical protein AQUCO_02700034v1 [Aquilegia coerulea]|uniref:Uncharacterized protein n=1 Tax=Aquilegia coerulea TaxID=218851 RepID=A0A2G5D4U6_AQUCA|nr:hypothetical protein AQUCO_02700034v1 [Aquilegia coerulea]